MLPVCVSVITLPFLTWICDSLDVPGLAEKRPSVLVGSYLSLLMSRCTVAIAEEN